jgi:hypothetical protein
MANIFTLENVSDFSEKISIDDLYAKKKQFDLNKLELFNKILNRIHVRIKLTSNQSLSDQHCWYVVPEIIIGVPKYDHGACIAYIMDKLKTNGFNVRYIHPNLLFISWMHWVPSYVRSELKKKTGIEINEFGEKVAESNNNPNNNNTIVPSINARPTSIYSSAIANAPPNDTLMLNMHSNNDPKEKVKKEYTPIKNYKPSGNLIYDDNLLPK